MGLILDSSVVIAAERQDHSVRQILEQIRAAHGETDIALSVVTIAELMHGAYRANDESRKRRRLAFTDRLCSDLPVHPVTIEIARRLGRRRSASMGIAGPHAGASKSGTRGAAALGPAPVEEGEQAAQGTVIAFEDLAIGVTALHLGYDVATLNPRHFQRIPGLTVIAL